MELRNDFLESTCLQNVNLTQQGIWISLIEVAPSVLFAKGFSINIAMRSPSFRVKRPSDFEWSGKSWPENQDFSVAASHFVRAALLRNDRA
jgi:hypothetical protein